ncbi:hypothetical protein SKTS_32230 [Sulfurimicrobium lacus]|uniref:VCBS repeat-containing protein n=1 Tax=Sulfurimicrobium lacus TaxID=2715678 RepID=A0A6F8VGV8_9PROT|nr:VCBS repeat-containing protein [Sulfurimicrobium lacus]BCB28337.1 hypothetical protein SKTS_32230 [Sulfurimicrobium lacus]
MKIASSDILLSSQHSAIDKHSISESLRAWTGSQRPDFEGRNTNTSRPQADHVALSSEGKAAQKSDPVADMQDAVDNDPRMQLLMRMIEALTGKKIKILSMKDLQPAQTPPPEQVQDPNQAAKEQPAQASAGFGVEYERHETHYEAEQTSFSAQGVVKTADGREITFSLQLNMSREYLEQSDVSVRLGDAARQAKDPLVINFSGNAAQLTSAKFSFDLDADGKTEQISFVAPGSGFLALDKNQDGKINNGSELFGPASGNGFTDLAAYDKDGNRWIDENDAVFNQLKVWSKDAQGNDQLASLKDAGVGAIYLGNAATEFSIKDASNRLDGKIRSSGVYLSEDGVAGTVQQVDLAA